MHLKIKILAIAFIISGSIRAQLVLETYFDHFEPAQPVIKFGGVATALAVHPTDFNQVFAVTERGGLMKTNNGGSSWFNVADFPGGHWVHHVQYAPFNPDHIIVITQGMLTTNKNEGGIWLSRNGGVSWERPAGAIPPASLQGDVPFTGYCIATFPGSRRIIAGTSVGIAISHNDGLTWSYEAIPGGAVYAAAVLRNNEMVVSTGAGIFFWDVRSGWRQENTGIGIAYPADRQGSHNSFHVPHRFFGDVTNANPVLVTTADAKIHLSRDGGRNWTFIDNLPQKINDAAKGTVFVKMATTGFRIGSQGLDLYVSNRYGIWRKYCERIGPDFNYRFTEPWQSILKMEHSDLSDMCLDREGNPWLLSGDGGIQKFWRDIRGDNFSFNGGGGSFNGFHSLEITEVNGVYIDSRKEFDMYFGTQDNSVWASENRGRTWERSDCCEGFFFELPARVSVPDEANVAYRACADCNDKLSRRLFNDIQLARRPAGVPVTNPLVYLNKNSYLMAWELPRVAAISGALPPQNTHYYITSNYSSPGVNPVFSYIITLQNTVLRGLPKKSATTVPQRSVLYQPYKSALDQGGDDGNIQRVKLLQLMVEGETLSGGRTFANGTARYPANRNLGSIGVAPTDFAWYEVFAVNPITNTHLIAADALNQRAVQSSDGGENWTEITELTALATEGGAKPFAVGRFTNLSAIKFNPEYPHMILAGTRESGIFYSWNAGKNWEKIPGSERITEVTSFFFQNCNTVWVSTYGRGLWKLQFMFKKQRNAFSYLFRNGNYYSLLDQDRFSRIMNMQQGQGHSDEFDQALIVAGGSIIGVSGNNGSVEQAQFTPNSSAIWLTDESRFKPPFTAIESAPDWQPGGELMTKISELQQNGYYISAILMKNNKLADIIYGKSPLPFPSEETPRDYAPVGEKEINPDLIPRLTLSSGNSTAGYFTLYPEEELTLYGSRFDGTSPYPLEFFIDGKPTTLFDGTKISPDGSFIGKDKISLGTGHHMITVKQFNANKEIISETDEFIVLHKDNPSGKANDQPQAPANAEQNPIRQKVNEIKQKVKSILTPKN